MECCDKSTTYIGGYHAAANGPEYVYLCYFSQACRQIIKFCVLAISLQLPFLQWYWISTLPPILFVLAFKIYINRKFLSAFQYYIPSDEELREAYVHSKRADNAGNKLEKRFGHPALHAELFTPMVHANMTHLLSEVFAGKIGKTKTKLDDLGGNNVDAAVVAGGVKIAGIDEVRWFALYVCACADVWV